MPSFTEVYRAGKRAFRTGQPISRCRWKQASHKRAWKLGWHAAKEEATPLEIKMLNLVRTCKVHLQTHDKVYVFLDVEGKPLARSPSKRKIDRLIGDSNYTFVGCYTKPLDERAVIDDIGESLKSIYETLTDYV